MASIFNRSEGADAKPIRPVTKTNLAADVERFDARVRGWIEQNGFVGAAGSCLAVPGTDGNIEGVLFGLGDGGNQLIFGALPGKLPKGTWRIDADWAPDAFQAAAIAFGLGDYRFTKYIEPSKDDVQLQIDPSCDGDEVERIVRGAWLARDLVNIPANDMGPEELEGAARALAQEFGADFSVIVGEDLLAQNFPLVHVVGRASDRAPRLIDFTWGNEQAPKVTLVGKGVCFDSGGLDLKPSAAMALMKKDMGGAANVLGLASMVMSANLPIRLRVLVPAVENSISGNAFRTSDIYKSRKGLTVEIGNTDAEGRLVLADALALADDEEPELLIDMATLTGAARVALGPDVPPFYTNDDELAAGIQSAGERVTDPVWRLPLVKTYDKWLNGKVADVKSVSDGPFAGSITAALFLKRFVEKAKQYVHFDIYAWTSNPRAGKPAGGEAHAIRALYAYLSDRYG